MIGTIFYHVSQLPPALSSIVKGHIISFHPRERLINDVMVPVKDHNEVLYRTCVSSASDAILYGFVWSWTPEGEEYWEHVYVEQLMKEIMETKDVLQILQNPRANNQSINQSIK